jgi:aminoglycoside 3-N-acetyltransferase
MRRLTRHELIAALHAAGVERGDVLHVQSDLRRIGPVEASGREGVLAFYLDALQEVLGPDGTLTCCTAFEDYGRYGTPFVREESPSLTDAFSEYVRTREGAVRSLHPIVSVTGLGARAEEICGGAHYEGFGWESAWGRLHRADAKIMTLGLGANHGGVTFSHYLETLYGVPYCYTKLYSVPVFAGGREVPGPFTMSVRFLDFGIHQNSVPLKRHLVAEGLARDVAVGRSRIWCATATAIIGEGVALLNRDRWLLLEQTPSFRQGELPADGVTGPMQVVYDSAAGVA